MLECEETQEVLCCHFEGEGLLRKTLQVTVFAPLIGTNWTVGRVGFLGDWVFCHWVGVFLKQIVANTYYKYFLVL